MIALAALYIICVVHAERFVDNTSNSTSTVTGGGGPGPDESSVPSSQISHNPHNTMHLHTQLHSMASKKGTGGGTSGTTATGSGTGLEGHGINNRNMVQWFADLNVDVEEVKSRSSPVSFCSERGVLLWDNVLNSRLFFSFFPALLAIVLRLLRSHRRCCRCTISGRTTMKRLYRP
jgi:hypothetical protein